MQLNKFEKITIIVVIFLVIGAIISIATKSYIPKSETKPIFYTIKNQNDYELPEYTKDISTKYQVYPDLYNSDEKLFVYGIEPTSDDPLYNLEFHKKMEKAYKKAHLAYKYVTYTDWEDEKLAIIVRNRNYINQDSCSNENNIGDKIENLIDTSENCFRKACIIDPQNNKYTLMSRDVDFIIQVLKEHNPQKVNN